MIICDVSIMDGMSMWVLWLVVAVALGVVEMLTLSAMALCMAVSALAAMVAALCGVGFEFQLLAFIVIAVVSLLFLGPLVRKLVHPQSHEKFNGGSNMEALIGRQIRLDRTLLPGETARVRIDGDSWQVRAEDSARTLDKDELYTVCAYDSIILLVK